MYTPVMIHGSCIKGTLSVPSPGLERFWEALDIAIVATKAAAVTGPTLGTVRSGPRGDGLGTAGGSKRRCARR